MAAAHTAVLHRALGPRPVTLNGYFTFDGLIIPGNSALETCELDSDTHVATAGDVTVSDGSGKVLAAVTVSPDKVSATRLPPESPLPSISLPTAGPFAAPTGQTFTPAERAHCAIPWEATGLPSVPVYVLRVGGVAHTVNRARASDTLEIAI